jgi:putative nucleotidyltransferase with HDIG domain
MTVTNPTNTRLIAGPSAGPFGWLVSLLRKMFGGSASSESTSAGNSVALIEHDESDGGAYVVAPGGYRIRVPKSDDVSTNVTDMIPSVKEGLNLVPPLPHVVAQLLKEIQDPNATASSVGDIAASDPAMAASLIRTVNSAAFGLTRKITSVAEAVSFLGFSSVKSMVVRLQLDQTLGGKSKSNAEVEDLWIHSLVVSYIADALARRVAGIDRGFVSTFGLLHDIGKLVVQTQFPQEAKLLSGSGGDEAPLDREIRVLGVDHAALGANLAAKWGLPGDLVQAIRWHHYPDRAFSSTDPKPLHQAMYLVQIANQLAKYCYVYQDETEIDAITEDAYNMVGLPHELTTLLTPEVRAAASRAIFFADDGSRRPITAVRRFLRLNSGEAAAALLASLQGTDGGNAQVEVQDLLCESLFGDLDAKEKESVKRQKFRTLATTENIAKLCTDIIKSQSALPLSVDARLSLSLVTRCVMANMVGEKNEVAEISQTHDGKRIQLALRSPALAFTKRFGANCDPDTAFAALDSELANLLNLGWFEEIGTSSDGSTLIFTAKAA